MRMPTVRLVLALCGCLPVMLQSARADELQDLATAAAKKPAVIWSESSEPAQMAKVIAAFNKHYPDIKVQFVQNTGGNTLAGRVVQETRAGTAATTLISTDATQLNALAQRDLVVKRDWTALGVDKALTPAPHLVSIGASIYAALWNKNKVSAADAPTSWKGLLDDRFKGKIGTWVRPTLFVQLEKALGEVPTLQMVQRLANLNPLLFQSTYSLAQQVGSGEIDVGYGIYHTSQPTIDAGAPIELRLFDPVPYDVIYAGVVSKSANPEGGQVLVAWLGSLEGALAYEEGTRRGNPAVKGTKAYNLVAGHTVVFRGYDEQAIYESLATQYTKILSTAATPAK